MNIEHPITGGDRVAFVAHDTIVAALDHLAAQNGESRSHAARRLIAERLHAAGLLPTRIPMTPAAGRSRRASTRGQTR